MKSTGMVRKVDELGRVVLPKELRSILNIDAQDPLEIYVDNDEVILKKYVPRDVCMITGESNLNILKLAKGTIVLSEEGAKLLKKELDIYLN